MQMVSKKDLDSAELETMRTSRSPAMVMTANGEVLAKEETTVYVKELDLFGTVMLLEEHPQFFHSESSARIMGILITGPAVKNHTSPKMERELIAIFHTMCHFVVPGLSASSSSTSSSHLLLQHFHHRILYLTSNDTPKIQNPKEVEARVRSYGKPDA